MDRLLIINADDFGLSEGVSSGIVRAHLEGVLTSTTYMVNFPWSEELAPLLDQAPELGVGVHLNLTTGSPVLPPEQVPSLVDVAGRFSKSLARVQFRIRPDEAFQEWSAQVEKCGRLLGRLPTHLDTHRYLQGFPGLAKVMTEVARRYKIPAVRSLFPWPGLDQTMFSAWNPISLLVNGALRRSHQVVQASGLRHPDQALAGDFDLTGLQRKLALVGPGVTELITHPGFVDDRLRSISSLQRQREIELAALTAPEARRWIEQLGIRLVSFDHFG